MKVIATVQSIFEKTTEPPVDIPWYSGDSEAKAIAAVASAIATRNDPDFTRTISIRIEF